MSGYDVAQDANEDIIVDATTGLEALLLGNEKRGKGALIAARAAAIIEEADDNRRSVKKRIERLCKVRSAILHGDVRPTMLCGSPLAREKIPMHIGLPEDLADGNQSRFQEE
jgi:hypothetical protein